MQKLPSGEALTREEGMSQELAALGRISGRHRTWAWDSACLTASQLLSWLHRVALWRPPASGGLCQVTKPQIHAGSDYEEGPFK